MIRAIIAWNNKIREVLFRQAQLLNTMAHAVDASFTGAIAAATKVKEASAVIATNPNVANMNPDDLPPTPHILDGLTNGDPAGDCCTSCLQSLWRELTATTKGNTAATTDLSLKILLIGPKINGKVTVHNVNSTLVTVRQPRSSHWEVLLHRQKHAEI